MSAYQGLELSASRCARVGLTAAVVSILVLAGCATQRPAPEPVEEDTSCKAAVPGDTLVGNWLSVRKQSGVAGELRTHFVLNADGTMSYGEQLQRSGKAPQGLSESGCWSREGGVVVMRTLESNGSPVDTKDPIYVNRYQIARESGDRLALQAPDGARLDAKRMPPDYRLPW